MKWCDKPPFSKYIGVYLDNRLKFIFHMKQVNLKVKSNLWRLRNHKNCVNSYTMNLMYFSYVFPQFLYGAPLWLFQCFGSVDCYTEPNFGYVGVYKQMNSLYIECAKLILGVNVNVSSIALLVRIGWLALNYVLAIQFMLVI